VHGIILGKYLVPGFRVLTIMKKIFIAATLSILSLSAFPGYAQTGWRDVVKGVIKNSANTARTNTGTGTGTGGIFSINSLSNADITAALRQALEIGSQNAGSRLNSVNGFFGNSLIKILMPPEARKMESTLRSFGFSQVADKAILAMNRAAEDAAGKAAPIFINAIRSMTITDAVNILRGGNGAATNYLRSATTASLTNAFRPVISGSLSKVGATAYWGDAMRIYNGLPITRNKINPDLTAYVTERALNGLFVNIADEETRIRTNPAARVTDLLKKVFGAQ
jgi:hypothetical protein